MITILLTKLSTYIGTVRTVLLTKLSTYKKEITIYRKEHCDKQTNYLHPGNCWLEIPRNIIEDHKIPPSV